MAEGYFDFTAGTGLAAANLEDYCELQGIMRFATAATRTTALSGVLIEGLMCYLKDLNVIQVYSGAAWSTIGPVHGALTSVTPVITQGAVPTFTNTHSSYMRIGRLVIGNCLLSVTSAGTAANPIAITGLPSCQGGVDVIGNGYITDTSVPTVFNVRPYFLSSTTIQFHRSDDQTNGALSTKIMGTGANAMTAALASGDVISFFFAYEAAADA